MNYTNQDIKRGELTGFFGFAAAILFALLITWVSGCGDPCGFGGCVDPAGAPPVVDIQCNDASCTILVYDAQTITTWHDGVFYWHEDVVPPGRRYTNRDQAPEVSITVEACNEYGCVERTLVLIEFAQNDPIGCDPNLPCPDVLA